MSDSIYINEDNQVTWDAMKLASSGEFVNDATVTYALKDNAGTGVSGGTGTLDYVSGSDGNYSAIIDKTVTTLLSEGAAYYLELTATSGSADGFRRIRYVATYQGAE